MLGKKKKEENKQKFDFDKAVKDYFKFYENVDYEIYGSLIKTQISDIIFDQYMHSWDVISIIIIVIQLLIFWAGMLLNIFVIKFWPFSVYNTIVVWILLFLHWLNQKIHKYYYNKAKLRISGVCEEIDELIVKFKVNRGN